MKGKLELLQMITQEDYGSLTNALEEFCNEKQHIQLGVLMDEFIYPSANFNLVLFKQRLKILVEKCYTNRNNVVPEVVDNTFYSALCKFDFETQTNHFQQIYKHKRIAPFLVHGKSDDNNLNWLCNQILYKSKLLGERSVTINCESALGSSFEIILDDLCRKLSVNTASADRILPNLRRAIEKRLERNSFVCIFKNASKILWNENELCKLFDKLFNYLEIEFPDDKSLHPFILLLIDANGTGYKDQYQKYIYWYNDVEQKGYTHHAIGCKDIRIFDLTPVSTVGEKDITNWLEWCQEEPVFYEQTKSLWGSEKELLKNGNAPFQVISQICKALEVKIDDTWIQ